MLTKLYLIRHGETEGVEAKRYKGHTDVPLSDNGIMQVKRVAKYIYQNTNSTPPCPPLSKGGQGGIRAVYTSDLIRAVKSAEIIAEPLGLQPIILKGLRERSFGLWEGMSLDEVSDKYPGVFKEWAKTPLEFHPIEGESTIELRDRTIEVFNPIIEKHKEEDIAIVAHGGTNRVIICELLGMPLENILMIGQDFAAMNLIEFYNGYPVAKSINFTV